jgi:hypothetical protein
MDMISAIIEKEYIREREGKPSTVAPARSTTASRRDYDD